MFYWKDFDSENSWAEMDLKITDVDPQMSPTIPWPGEQLHKPFLYLKTKFVLVDEVFYWLGNLEVDMDINEADHFDGHVHRLLPSEKPELHKLLQFAFWAFENKPHKFIPMLNIYWAIWYFPDSRPNNYLWCYEETQKGKGSRWHGSLS